MNHPTERDVLVEQYAFWLARAGIQEARSSARRIVSDLSDHEVTEVRRELSGAENPAYGPGNPDWEHDREREDRP